MSEFRSLLIIGDNHEELSLKYSQDCNKQEVVKYKLNEAPKLHQKYLVFLENLIKQLKDKPDYPNKEEDILNYESLYKDSQEMDDFEFYETLTYQQKCNEDGDVVVQENPLGFYKNQRCYDKQIKLNQDDEAPFLNPFILLDGTKAYSAKVGEIDWDIVHLGKSSVYEAVWEICVEGRKPNTPDEEVALKIMGGKDKYFSNFKTKEEYVGHCSAFWCYSIINENGYTECNGRDIDWTNNFYEKYIKPLSSDTLITLYEIQTLI